MSVNYCKTALVVLCSNFTGRICAESSHLIIKGWCVVNKLCLIKIFIEELHYLIPYFNADSYINCSRFCLDSNLFALILEPVCALSSDSRHNFFCQESLPFICHYSCSNAVLHNDILDHCIKLYCDTLA